MVIQNNNIYITRGEEATFRATIYMNDGTPFRLLKPPKGNAPHDLIYFTVKTDAFSSDKENLSDDKKRVLRYEIDLDEGENPIKKFASYDIYKLAAEPTDDGHPANASDLATITNNGKDVLYFYRDDTGKRTFYTAEYTTGLDVGDVSLERYVFDITFVIPTKDTKELFAKTYYWELDWVSTSYDVDTKISKKFPLITPSQFIVRGSIYD